mgnify:CR=1 FL=1
MTLREIAAGEVRYDNIESLPDMFEKLEEDDVKSDLSTASSGE